MSGEFAKRRVVVMGLGRFGGGIGAAQWLARQGAEVIVTDRADESMLADSIARLAGLGIAFRCGRHAPADLDGADLLVVSPAVDKGKSEFVGLARRRGIPITSEMNLFFERCRGRIVGVTGTTGKSTTCAMLHAVLAGWPTASAVGDSNGLEYVSPTAKAMGHPPQTGKVLLGGNIGQSLLEELERIGTNDIVVLELSSFQLEDIAVLKKSPPVAVITNVSHRHLDRHGTYADYFACKLNICRHQHAGDIVVLGSDNSHLLGTVTEVTDETGARVVVVGDDDGLILKVLGVHNRRNASVAAHTAALLGVGRGTVLEALADFGGLPHRLQFVRQVGGADYYNDSKATSPEAVAAALSSFDRAVILIAGGQDRPESWEPVLASREHKIKHAICTAENGRMLAEILGGTAVATLEEAVTEARRLATAGGVVLFSPGSPSYDRYVNYEARGEAFIRLVERL